MNNDNKKPTSMLIGGIITGVISVCLVVFRTLCVSELGRIKSGSQQLVGIGFKDPYSPDYTAYLENLVGKSTLTIISFVLLTVVLVALFVIQSKSIAAKAATTASVDSETEQKEVEISETSENKSTTDENVEKTDDVSYAS